MRRFLLFVFAVTHAGWLMSLRITNTGCTETRLIAEMTATINATPDSQPTRFCSRSMASTWKSVVSNSRAMPDLTFPPGEQDSIERKLLISEALGGFARTKFHQVIVRLGQRHQSQHVHHLAPLLHTDRLRPMVRINRAIHSSVVNPRRASAYSFRSKAAT